MGEDEDAGLGTNAEQEPPSKADEDEDEKEGEKDDGDDDEVQCLGSSKDTMDTTEITPVAKASRVASSSSSNSSSSCSTVASTTSSISNSSAITTTVKQEPGMMQVRIKAEPEGEPRPLTEAERRAKWEGRPGVPQDEKDITERERFLYQRVRSLSEYAPITRKKFEQLGKLLQC